MNRRKFIGTTAILASSSAVSASLPLSLKAFAPPSVPDVVICKGTDYFYSTKLAVEKAGGIGRFVPENSSVGLLINSRFDFLSAMVKPDIPLALLDLLMQTHPREVILLQVVDQAYWELSQRCGIMKDWPVKVQQVMTNIPPAIYNTGDFTLIPFIPGAKYLKDIEVVKRLLDVEVLINVPQIKHHNLTLVTGALKNSMGVCTRETNVSFHLGSGVRNDPAYLAQCITDINLLRRPDLVVADATELIVNNGPAGPGDTIRPDKILVSNDPVAVDSLGAIIMGYDPADILSIVCSSQAGLGKMDTDSLNILECFAEQ